MTRPGNGATVASVSRHVALLGHTACASTRHAAAAQRIRLQIAKTLGQLARVLRIPKDAASLARQRGVFRVSRRLYEVIVGQRLRNAVDRAGTLIHSAD